MRVKEIMTSPAVTVGPEVRVKDVAALLVEHKIGAVPVVTAGGRLAGIVSEADLVALESAPDPRLHALVRLTRSDQRTPTLVRDLMTKEVVYLHPDSDVAEAARLMVKRGVRSIPIVDGKEVVGMVARRDLIKVLAREDADIRAELGELLEEQAGLLLPFQVAVRNGVVTLTGPADQDSRNLAKLLARTVPGVIAVRFADLPAEIAREHHTAHRA